ncbi:RNA polymerase sigma factor SigX [Fictibacillus macauensis ZFHKF-1]|uniref:RNA polymerase sigma factor n=1 Tax=Fictibacillus macauensis ZFHKF-1 TaxID=1196324 RepID=I8UKP7_9BACL|nr:RNA polymerase sigma factor SigX [Fictibacillus macauensis]EIT87403.1 RNA polymerase sigma factor SigX [Fictibacillus macauensis ZFHKF-1]
MKDVFERLYEEYHQPLFQFIFYMVRNKEAAEDIVQEVYIKVMKAYSSFAGKSSEKTWLFSIARHVTIDWLRKQNRRKKRVLFFSIGESEDRLVQNDPLPDEFLTQKESVKELYHALYKCTLPQQQVIVLRYIQSLSIAETAAVLGWTESKVKTTQHRAIKGLKSFLDETPGLKEEWKDGVI